METVAVCDLWSVAREHRAAQVRKAFHLEPQVYRYPEQMLERQDSDGVMIATGDFQHAKLRSEVVRAGKDCSWKSHSPTYWQRRSRPGIR